MARARRGVATQIILLVAGAVLAATAALFLVTFRGPPPMAAPVSLDEVARVLTGERASLPGGERVLVGPRGPAGPGEPNPVATRELAWRLPGQPLAVFTHKGQDGPTGGHDELVGGFSAGMRLADGRWRTVSVGDGPLITRWHLVTLGAMLGIFIVVLIGARVVARAIARPLAEVAEAARATDDAGAGPPLPAHGPAEVARMAEAVAAMRARLSEAIDARTAMLLGIAHDLGTPLNRLAFRAQGLVEVDRAAAQAEIDGMRAMLARVLDYARDGVDAPLGPVDLAAVVALACERAGVGFAVPAQTWRITRSPSESRPPPMNGRGWTLTGDALALERLFANLLDNAEAYGGGAEVTMAVIDGVARVEIADRGPGIDPALLPRLFEPFVRGEPSRNRATGGSGLGLAIARRIAERHGGTIEAANREGGGAVFTVVVPVE